MSQSAGRGRTRSPGFVYSAASAVILVVIATLTITAATTAPPAIAELSPQAVQQIKDAPQEQTSELGSAEGGAGTGDAATTTTAPPAAAATPGAPLTTTTTLPAIERARVRRCVGNPPRQTEDPQSPPCVPFWTGDNGGATYKGITADTITVALPHGSERVEKALEAYFNKRFEFYGRRIDLIRAGGGNTCSERKASAVYIDEELKAFGALNASYGNAGSCLSSELARRKLMAVINNPDFAESPTSQELAPYLWQYGMAQDRAFSAIGEVACKRLAGESAGYSTDPLLRVAKRKFGLILQTTLRDVSVDVSPIERQLQRCGETLEVFRYAPSNDDTGLLDPSRATQAILTMQQADVTTVICLCLVFIEQFLPPAATQQNYYPEWFMSSYGGNDGNLAMKTFWPEARHRAATFGVGFRPPMRSIEREPAWWALQEVDPSISPQANRGDVDEFFVQYQALMVMASGIQMAGPVLTPETFSAGLHRTVFPNATDVPDAGDPIKSGRVGFLDRDHSMIEDAVEYWWSETTKSPNAPQSDGGPGAFCYIDNADRRTPGQWPAGKNPFFQGICDPEG